MRAIIISFITFAFSLPAIAATGGLTPAWWTAPFDGSPEAKTTISMAEVFTPGYQAIQNKYITSIDLQPLVADSLKQLSAIDNLFQIRTDEEKITIFYSGQKHKSLRIKPSDSGENWAKATAAAISEARKLSPKIASVNIEILYALVYNSILSHLDKTSHYLPPHHAQKAKIEHHGFGKVGISVRPTLDGLEVTDVDIDYPCPLLIGDIITYIDGKPVNTMEAKDIQKAFSGKPDSTISVNIRYKEAPIILKRKFTPPPIPGMLKMLSSDVALITIPAFTSQTAYKVEAAVTELPANTKGLIFDLRGNQGGLLSEAVKLADLFIKSGMITEVKGRAMEATAYYQATPKEIWENKPIVILIDGKTVSAAEVFAAAMQQNHRATVIGATSYGKGTVQTAVPLPNKGELMLTWAEIYTSKGNSLDKNGVSPDICLSAKNPCPKAIIESEEELFSTAISALGL
ncbi:MAG: hypothetical protein IKD08_02070 [Alphaproteobacteria bacterium]|nr:hypothetical protein [Alphaproteobacteria bacterium]